MSKEILLDVRHLTQQFHLTKKIKVKAVDDVSFQIHKGEIFGLVGESGSGKSTVARCLMNIYQPAQGEIWYKDVNICDKKEFKKHKKMLQTRRQMIFQDSASSLNQKMKVSDIITEPMRIQHITPPRGSFVKEAAFQMEYVGLENRVIHCKEELIQLENEIDYFSADQVIKDFREESRAALLRALSEIAEG